MLRAPRTNLAGHDGIAPRRSGFWASGEARDVKMLKSSSAPLFLVTNNNSATQAYYLIK
ncbi:MAG: hypothetical protein ACKOCH_09440 [Bacteroidota bacterium]